MTKRKDVKTTKKMRRSSIDTANLSEITEEEKVTNASSGATAATRKENKIREEKMFHALCEFV